MGILEKEIELCEIINDYSLRFDVDYQIFNKQLNFNEASSFSDLFEIVKRNKIEINELEDFFYAEINNVKKTGEVEPVKLNVNIRDEINEQLFKKIEKGDIILPSENDILISSVRPNLKKFVLVPKDNQIYFTKAFIHLRPRIIPEILYYSLRSVFFKNLIVISRQGKGYPTIKSEDLRSIRFEKKYIDKLVINKDVLTKKIKACVKGITKLRERRIIHTDIINNNFQRYFNFNDDLFRNLQSNKFIMQELHRYGNNYDLRFSYKFHNKAGEFAENSLRLITRKKIKDFLVEDITLGKGISPNDYEEDGQYYYISMADIKNWCFDFEDAKKVTQEYYENYPNKRIKVNDIIMARSGEGTIGKVAIIESDELEGIYADFTMRIRLKNYNPLFAYYFFRTDLFQYLIYTHKKGLGNNTNIFPNQIKEFPLPDISLSEQNEIVKEIKNEIDEQNEIEKKIEEKQNEIIKIIENTIKN